MGSFAPPGAGGTRHCGAVKLPVGLALLGPASNGLESLDDHVRDRLVDQELDRGERLALIGAYKQIGQAIRAHPAGPADTVEIILGVVGDVEIDDVADPADVDAAAD